MDIQTGTDGLSRLLVHQLHNLYIFESSRDIGALTDCLPEALRRTETCFAAQQNKYYHRNGAVYFNPFHTGQYAVFLYFVGNTVWRQGYDPVIADKLYALNKALHGFDLFYEVDMPPVWFCDHPVGSVIGRAKIGNGFSFAQMCTVGNNQGFYPEIGTNVQMCCGATVLGQSVIGDNTVLSAHSYVKDSDIPSNTTVFGRYPDLVLRPNREVADEPISAHHAVQPPAE